MYCLSRRWGSEVKEIVEGGSRLKRWSVRQPVQDRARAGQSPRSVNVCNSPDNWYPMCRVYSNVLQGIPFGGMLQPTGHGIGEGRARPFGKDCFSLIQYERSKSFFGHQRLYSYLLAVRSSPL